MSNLNTPLSFRFKDDYKSTESPEVPAWENLKCLDHPQFKVDAICVNEEKNELRLLCIKCIIEAETYSIANGDKLMTMKEVIQKYVDNINTSGGKISSNKIDLQDTFLAFLTKDYSGLYEQRSNNQFKIIDNEIKDLIQHLSNLRERVKEHFDSEAMNIKSKADEVKTKIKAYLEDSFNHEAPRPTSLHEIQERLNRITTRDELFDFMRQLYFRSMEASAENEKGPDCKSTLSKMEEIKQQVATSYENSGVDVSRLRGTTYFFLF
jgi:hypothetical protein